MGHRARPNGRRGLTHGSDQATFFGLGRWVAALHFARPCSRCSLAALACPAYAEPRSAWCLRTTSSARCRERALRELLRFARLSGSRMVLFLTCLRDQRSPSASPPAMGSRHMQVRMMSTETESPVMMSPSAVASSVEIMHQMLANGCTLS